jgi:hypothetical protein
LPNAAVAFLNGYYDWFGWVWKNLLYRVNSVLLMCWGSNFKG